MRKIKVLKSIMFFLGVFLLASCASNKASKVSNNKYTNSKEAPIWVSNVNATYPDFQWLAAVGYETNRAAAEKNALAELSKIIKQHIDSEATLKQTDTRIDTKNDTESTLVQEYTTNVKTSSVIDEINGMAIQEVWTDSDGSVYAVATINRTVTGLYYSDKIKQYNDVIMSEIANAKKQTASLLTVKALLHAVSLATENSTFIDILSVVNPMQYKLVQLDYESVQAVELLAKQEIQKITIGISVEGDVSGRITQAFSKELSDAGFNTKVITDLSKKESNNLQYYLKAITSIEPIDMNASNDYKYVRYVINTNLIDSSSDKSIMSYSMNGREAKMSVSEAQQKALRSIEQDIASKYSKEFFGMLKNN
ncbi:MAG: hypothetical protein BKP49_03030 [Treponema sp. CETP13]|nr:MAG: hypothetical protein BKP49_03030 [Treponema sp. CETP13]